MGELSLDPIHFLNELWKESAASLQCRDCGKAIHPDDVLARTFTVREHDPRRVDDIPQAKEINVLSSTIIFHDRHLDCLLNGETKVVNVSHVWDPDVSKLQYDYSQQLVGYYSPNQILSVADTVRQVPLRIYQGLIDSKSREVPTPLEVWHDYICVPQWDRERKSRIISAIPRLYQHAAFVVVYMSDLNRSSIQMMRSGPSIEDRVRGMTDVCNARWFRRMWTAMECVQSSELRLMLRDFSLVEAIPEVPFYDEPVKYWDELTERERTRAWESGKPSAPAMARIMQMAGVGRNILPYHLGPVSGIRAQRLQGEQVPFAQCFILISRRQVTNPVDFLHALLGLVGLAPEESSHFLPHNHEDKNETVDLAKTASDIARACLKKGDLTPLFIMPWKRDPVAIKNSGFDEFGMFGLGMKNFSPEFPHVTMTIRGNPILRIENIGTVVFAKRFWRTSDLYAFHELARLVLEFTGPNADLFAETVSCRFFGEYLHTVRENLANGTTRPILQHQLEELYNSYPMVRQQIISDSIADLLKLNKGHLGSVVPETFAPLDWMDRHGKVIHSQDQRIIVCVECISCHKRFLLQAGMIFRNPVTPSEIYGAVAYRVPGLKYDLTHRGGAGWLIKDDRIVARFIWAASTCECRNIQDLEIPFPDDWLPAPWPNNFPYGDN